MKTVIRIGTFCFAFIFLLNCFAFALPITADANVQNPYYITEPYEYPIVPGTDEWRNLNSLYDMVQACAVPQEVLEHMTTHALAETVLNYPFMRTQA